MSGCLPRNALKMVLSGPRSTEKRPKQQICTEASLFLQTNRVHKALRVGSNAFQHVWSGSRSVFGSGPDSKSDLGRMQARQVRIPVVQELNPCLRRPRPESCRRLEPRRSRQVARDHILGSGSISPGEVVGGRD